MFTREDMTPSQNFISKYSQRCQSSLIPWCGNVGFKSKRQPLLGLLCQLCAKSSRKQGHNGDDKFSQHLPTKFLAEEHGPEVWFTQFHPFHSIFISFHFISFRLIPFHSIFSRDPILVKKGRGDIMFQRAFPRTVLST